LGYTSLLVCPTWVNEAEKGEGESHKIQRICAECVMKRDYTEGDVCDAPTGASLNLVVKNKSTSAADLPMDLLNTRA
jgi:hypothetical protein